MSSWCSSYVVCLEAYFLCFQSVALQDWDTLVVVTQAGYDRIFKKEYTVFLYILQWQQYISVQCISCTIVGLFLFMCDRAGI